MYVSFTTLLPSACLPGREIMGGKAMASIAPSYHNQANARGIRFPANRKDRTRVG